MNILLIGGGGRESALAWKMAKSPYLDQLYILPGNAGTLQYGKNIKGNPLDFDFVKNVVAEYDIHMVVVGPEDPLVNGITDYFSQQAGLAHVKMIGPGAMGARLEGSKDWAKHFMNRHHIPTAASITVSNDNIEEGFRFIDKLNPPYVLKADGLAAGKGVLITSDFVEAKSLVKEMVNGMFGNASSKIVIEEFLKGIELSCFIAIDGRNYVLLPEAKDYKKVGENDTGPNTGGMGAVSPVSFADKAFMEKVVNRIIEPTVKGLHAEGIDYQGFIFFGLMNVEGNPFVIEYNCRLGDPETEVIIPRLESDIIELMLAVSNQSLHKFKVQVSPYTAATVMLVSGGYPGEYQKGYIISGLQHVANSVIFHAGTSLENAQTVTSGGRVMAVTSVASGLNQALKLCYRNAGFIQFEGKYFRPDIGFDIKY